MVFIQRPFFVGALAAAVGFWNVAPALAGDMKHQPLTHINGRFFAESDGQVVEIPDITMFCLGCHDGTAGPARQGPVDESFDSLAQCRGLSGAHPVEVVYPVGKAHYEFADPMSLPDRMLFAEGRMTCVSCHDLEAETHGLVIANRRSALCLTCHRK